MITSARSDRCGILASVKLSVNVGEVAAWGGGCHVMYSSRVIFFPPLPPRCLVQMLRQLIASYGTFSSQFPKRLL